MSDEEYENDSIVSENEESLNEYSDDDDQQSEDIEEEIYQPSEDDENSDIDTIEGEQDDEMLPEPEYKSKFEEHQRENYIAKYHPEEIHKSFDEIHKLSMIERDIDGRIIDENHRTYPILSKYEKTSIIGERVTQLNRGAKPYVELQHSNILDNSLIAEKELKAKKLPFIIMRPLPNGTCEYWNVNDLEYI